MRKQGLMKYKAQLSIFTLVLFCLTLLPINAIKVKAAVATQKIKIRFFKADGNYTGWNIHAWGVEGASSGMPFLYSDEKGVYTVIDLPTTGELGFIVRRSETGNDWAEKATKDVKYDLSKGEKEIVITYGSNENPQSIVEEDLYKSFAKMTVNVHYFRTKADYADWNLWNWIPKITDGANNPTPGFTVTDSFGKVGKFDLTNTTAQTKEAAFIIRTDSWAKDGNDDRIINLAYANCNGILDVYVNQGDNANYYTAQAALDKRVSTPEVPARVPVLVGNLQSEMGESGDWNPGSTKTVFKELGDGFYSLTAVLPASVEEYQYKVAFGSWSENYGVDGKLDGANIKLKLEQETTVTFYYSDKTHKVTDSTKYTPVYDEDHRPRLAGTIQSAMGEAGDWNPGASKLKLYDHNFDGKYSIDLLSVPMNSKDNPAYQFKIVTGNDWPNQNNANGIYDYGDNGQNFIMNVFADADVTVNFNNATKVITYKVHATLPGEYDGQVDGTKLYHNTWDSTFKLPFGAVAEDTAVTLRMQAAKGDLQYARALVRNNNNNKSDLYNMEKVATTDANDIWEVTFTPDSKGVYGYKFIVGDGDTVKYYGEDGSEGKIGMTGDKNISFFQLTVYDKNYTTPDWMKESVVYQIFPDRFFNGDKTNDTAKTTSRGNEPIEKPLTWNSLPDNPRLLEKKLNDVNGLPYAGDSIWSNDFYGGDIKGVVAKLDYIQSLGVNTIYLNPVAMAASNHKYDATDYKKLDPMFGSEADFKAFTSELKKRNMHLIIDGVFNHVGDDSVYFDRYGKYPTVGAYEYWSYVYDQMNADKSLSKSDAMAKADKYFVAKGQVFSSEKWHLWFNIKNEKVNVGTTNERYDYQAWWGFDSLPEFKSMTKEEAISLGLATASDNFVDKESEYNNKVFVNYIYKSDDSVAKQWIKWGADGWRLDVANEVETTFWNEFRDEVKTFDEDALILGEIWNDASQYFIGDQYDSVMNYRIRGALIDYLKNGNATRLNDTLMAIQEDYPREAFEALMNLMGSHDTARAKYILGGGLDTFERAEFDKNYNPVLGEQRLMLAALFEFGYPGAPTVYYGDEAGVEGTKDPDCRRTYPWGNEDKDLVSYYSSLGQIRQANKDLFAHGDVTTLYAGTDGVYVYGRTLNGKTALVATNPTGEDKSITIDMSKFTGNTTEYIDQLSTNYKVTVVNGSVTISVPKLTGRIMTSKNTVSLPEAVNAVNGTENNGSVSLNWTSVQGAKAYKVYSSNFKGGAITELTTVETNSATISNLTNGTKVYFAVATVDENGNKSPLTWSEGYVPHYTIEWAGNLTDVTVNKVDIANPIEVKTEVYIPGVTNLEGVTSGLYGRLLVKYPGDSEFTVIKAKYISEKGNNDLFSATFIPTKAGEYEYKFEFTTRGVNGFNDGIGIYKIQSKTVTLDIADNEKPADSINLEKIDQRSGEVNLKWAVSGTNKIAMYEIVRDGVVVARLSDPTAVSYKDIDVRNKVTYKYQVIGYSNGGNAVISNEQEIMPDLVMVEVTFKLKAPAYTPLDTKVTIPGTMNGWNSGAWEMSRGGAVTTDWTYTTQILEGETIEYKYVKGGSWNQEALMKYTNPKAANQSLYGCTTGEGGNEKVTIANQGNGKMVIENEVIRWKDMPVVILDPMTGSTTNNETITIKGNAMLDPNLTINGEKVVVDANGNFAHTTKLAYGKNSIKIHIEPTEANKNNPDIFNNNAEALGFATKDLTLDITRLGSEEKPPVVVNPDNGSVTVDKITDPNGKTEVVVEADKKVVVEITDIDAIKNGTGSVVVKQGNSVVNIPLSLIDESLLKEGSKVVFTMSATESSELTKGLKAVNKVFEFNLSVVTGDEAVSIHSFKDGLATITLTLSDEDLKGLDKSKLAVFYYNETTKKYEAMETIVDGNRVTFKTPHFSKFIIAEKIVGTDGATLPNTGGRDANYVLFLGLTLILAGSSVFFRRREKLQN